MSDEEKDIIAVELLTQIVEEKEGIQTFGLPEIYDTLNSEEKKLVVLHPAEALTVYAMSTRATQLAITYFTDGNADNNNGNAFKHAYWNTLLTVELGYNGAKRWATAHEHGQTGLNTTMDLRNNEEGRLAGEMIVDFYDTLYGRKPTYAEARNAIFSRIDRGELVRIINNSLVPTDSSDNINR